jgi:hypothetical protein
MPPVLDVAFLELSRGGPEQVSARDPGAARRKAIESWS